LFGFRRALGFDQCLQPEQETGALSLSFEHSRQVACIASKQIRFPNQIKSFGSGLSLCALARHFAAFIPQDMWNVNKVYFDRTGG
jgi:hypothetical protein